MRLSFYIQILHDWANILPAGRVDWSAIARNAPKMKELPKNTYPWGKNARLLFAWKYYFLSFIHKFDVMTSVSVQIEMWNVFIALFIPRIPAQTSSRELRVRCVLDIILKILRAVVCGGYISVHTCDMA